MQNIDFVKAVVRDAHQQYLNTWEIKTQVAESNGVWTPEVQRLVLENMEKMSSSLKMLARAVQTELEATDAKTEL